MSARDRYVVRAGAALRRNRTNLTLGSFTEPPPPNAPNARIYPFAGNSIWKTSLGSGAIYTPSTGLGSIHFTGAKGQFNWKTFTLPIWEPTTANGISFVIRLHNTSQVTTGSFTVLCPPSAERVLSQEIYDPNVTSPDSWMAIIRPDGETVDCFYKFMVDNTNTATYKARSRHTYSLLGDGITSNSYRASMIPDIAGTIMKEEVASNATPRDRIKHALCMALPNESLYYGGSVAASYQWPAKNIDGSGPDQYAGNVKMGALIAIPPSINLLTDSRLAGITDEGLALAYALQDYGAYVVDRSAYATLYAELGSDNTRCTNMKADYQNKLFPLLEIVSNSSSTNVGGGGTRRRGTQVDPVAAPM